MIQTHTNLAKQFKRKKKGKKHWPFFFMVWYYVYREREISKWEEGKNYKARILFLCFYVFFFFAVVCWFSLTKNKRWECIQYISKSNSWTLFCFFFAGHISIALISLAGSSHLSFQINTCVLYNNNQASMETRTK